MRQLLCAIEPHFGGDKITIRGFIAADECGKSHQLSVLAFQRHINKYAITGRTAQSIVCPAKLYDRTWRIVDATAFAAKELARLYDHERIIQFDGVRNHLFGMVEAVVMSTRGAVYTRQGGGDVHPLAAGQALVLILLFKK